MSKPQTIQGCLIILFLVLSQGLYAQEGHKMGTQDVTSYMASGKSSVSEPIENYQDLLTDELYGEDGVVNTDIHIPDPLYYFNYVMYSFNDGFYYCLLKPITTGYKHVTPAPVRSGIQNFFHNLLSPVRLVNNLLQGKIKSAGTEVEIFLINSTIGLLGFMTPAQDQFEIYTSDEDLGQTLGSYDIGDGFYLVLPFLGPSTLRDTIGIIGDSFLKPVSYIESVELAVGITAFDTVNRTSFTLGDYDILKKSALDPYQALKSVYIQNRYYKINH